MRFGHLIPLRLLRTQDDKCFPNTLTTTVIYKGLVFLLFPLPTLFLPFFCSLISQCSKPEIVKETPLYKGIIQTTTCRRFVLWISYKSRLFIITTLNSTSFMIFTVGFLLWINSSNSIQLTVHYSTNAVHMLRKQQIPNDFEQWQKLL